MNRKEKVGGIREMKQEEDDDEDRKKVKNYVEEEGKNPKDGKEEKLDPPDNPKTFVTPGRTVTTEKARYDDDNDENGKDGKAGIGMETILKDGKRNNDKDENDKDGKAGRRMETIWKDGKGNDDDDNDLDEQQ